MVYSGNNY
jgi:hypothetical protein